MSQLEYCLGKHCGITFAGLKEASLFRLKKIYSRDLAYYAACFAQKGFTFEILRDDGEWLLLFVYHGERLWARLKDSQTEQFLEDYGYRYTTVDDAVALLKAHFAGDAFPHEIGVFLGYNLSDVKSFILHPDEGVVLTGCWKVYGDAEKKAELFRKFERCSSCICEKLRGGTPLTQIFNLA